VTREGIFIACRIQDAPKIEADIKLFAVRIAKFVPNGWMHNDVLCPSKTLLFAAKQLEEAGKWNQHTFDTIYRPHFVKEMSESEEARKHFKRILRRLREGKDIAFACYCQDYCLCHRSIIADWVKAKDFHVIRS
jgi:uncharacterized protein YeaO (DUF488 family)